MKKVNKVVLAYSGGLDTSVILRWLKENYQCEVVTFTADLGQEEDFASVEAKAKQQGTSEIFIEDFKYLDLKSIKSLRLIGGRL